MTKKISFILILLVVFVSLTVWMLKGRHVQVGIASRYSDFLKGRKTANGERYDPTKLTAAHRKLPFGSMVKVTNLENKKEVIVRINDRGPYVKGRIIDLSRAAAQRLGMIKKGIVKVRIKRIK